jgi:flagellum-specific ATP synthase
MEMRVSPQILNAPLVPIETKWQQFLYDHHSHLDAAQTLLKVGRLTRVSGIVMEAVGLSLPVGATCYIIQQHSPGEQQRIEAEVVGFAEGKLFLMAVDDVYGLTPGAEVVPVEAHINPPQPGFFHHPWRRPEDKTRHLPMGEGLLGRVIGPNGQWLDKGGALLHTEARPIRSRPLNPIDREPIRETLDVGVRAINALLTVGRGQRIGLFAGSGVGKSVLLGMMARHTTADVIVVGLIGERGREVKEFITEILGPEGMRRAVVVAAPADMTPLMRMQGASYATAIAEHFRDKGKSVLLLMDSLTRYAMAHREIALAIGEPPATKGYPPSVFAKLPGLVERAGMGESGRGSITAFYTVLAEGDDQQDPIADNARAILDGHIVLSRKLAEAGHYPAIDIEQSISRVMHSIVETPQLAAARHVKALVSRYQRNRDLIAVGAYLPGSDPVLDEAIHLNSEIEHFLQQHMNEKSDITDSITKLLALTSPPPSASIH